MRRFISVRRIEVWRSAVFVDGEDLREKPVRFIGVRRVSVEN
jgi:hypothetical protein